MAVPQRRREDRLVAAGVITRRRSRSFRDYATGGGAIPDSMLAVSFMANYLLELVRRPPLSLHCNGRWITDPRFAVFADEAEAAGKQATAAC